MKNLINANNYIKSTEDLESLKILMAMFDENIKPDGVRNRAYLKLIWNRALNKVTLAKNQNYFQSAGSNIVDGGKIRKFAVMDKHILDLPVMKNVIQANLKIIKDFPPLKDHQELVLGLHFIQYKANKYGASYSSPASLHRDDEPLVFVHLLNLTPNAWGGDNLIADLDTREITNVVRLEKPFETIVLTRDYYHAVTALGAREGEARRDILLFTVEPGETQVESVA
ncbi:MAG: 2OG-Fe dioxygenase family protein [Gammaproteobacteria bacterium]